MERESRSGGFSGSIVGLGRREAEGWGCKGRERGGGAGEEQFMSSCMGAECGESSAICYGVMTAWVEALTLMAAVELEMVFVRVIVHGTLN